MPFSSDIKAELIIKNLHCFKQGQICHSKLKVKLVNECAQLRWGHFSRGKPAQPSDIQEIILTATSLGLLLQFEQDISDLPTDCRIYKVCSYKEISVTRIRTDGATIKFVRCIKCLKAVIISHKSPVPRFIHYTLDVAFREWHLKMEPANKVTWQ